jgi:glutamine cyclotransferase
MTQVAPALAQTAVPVVARAKLLGTHPHDTTAFTEGLLFRGGRLYESTGLEGASEIREIRLADGRAVRRATVPSRHFGEGMVDWGDEFLSVTWRTGVGYRWDARTLRLKSTFRYPGEGWGMTRDRSSIVLSDGTSSLRFMDPVTFKERRRVSVSFRGKPITMINELEWIDGEIWANIWMTNMIARIDPATGVVRSWVDITAIADLQPKGNPDAIANGIAWDATNRRLYVTGKNWNAIYQIAVPGLAGGRRPTRR